MAAHRLRPIAVLALLLAVPAAAEWRFTEVTAEAGLVYEHGFGDDPVGEPHLVSGGVAAGDFDGDRWPDLYVVRGSLGPNLLFRNLGDGTFEEIGSAAGVAIDGDLGVGPTFADLDGDGRLDLAVGGIAGTAPRLFRNRGDRTFEEVTAAAGVFSNRDTFSTALGDYDRDGDLDLFLSHWSPPPGDPIGAPHLWRNDSGESAIVFRPVDFAAGIAPVYQAADRSFTPTFADLDGDGWPDLVVAGDFGTSQVFRNAGPGADGTVRFDVLTGPVISDENGMGSAVGDYDNDGDLDWFVSSIWDPDGVAEGNWGVSGNRLYKNAGDGTFDDATDEAGVRRGYWGWGSCFADFNNDGWLDLFHTNGFEVPGSEEFHRDPARIFVSNGPGPGGAVAFSERAAELGLDDLGQGRGVVCFDYDRDGDVDLFVANNGGPPLLYRNDGAVGSFLHLRLRGKGRNSEAIGARVTVTASGVSRLREIHAGSNYVSQNPAVAHFGLGDAEVADEVYVRWPDGEVTVLEEVAADQFLEIDQDPPTPPPIEVPALGEAGRVLAVLWTLGSGLFLLRRRGLRCGSIARRPPGPPP